MKIKTFRIIFICMLWLIALSCSEVIMANAETDSNSSILLSFGYDPDSDSIWFVTSEPGVQVWCANVKKEIGTSLKGRAFVTKHSSYEYSEKKSGYVGRFSLCDAEYGFDISPSKTAYMYITAEKPNKTKTKYSPNLIIDGSPYKKLEVVLDYAAADEGSERCAVKSLTLTDKGGSKVEYSTSMNKTEFDSKLESLLYGIYDEDRYLDLEGAVYEEDDTTLGYDELPKGISLTFRSKFFPGRFVYREQTGADGDWFYESIGAEDWINLKVYNYRCNYDRSRITLDISSGQSGRRLYYAGNIGEKYFAAIYDSTKDNSSILLENARFVYYEYDVDGSALRDFYRVYVSNDGTITRTSRKLSDYGLEAAVTDPEIYFIQGDTIDVYVNAARTAADYGIIVQKAQGADTPVSGKTSFTIKEVTTYSLTGDLLYELIMNNSDLDADFTYKLGFRYRGSSATGGRNAYRTGSPVMVSVKNAPAQIVAKFDTSTDSLVINNGCDFMVITEMEAAYRSGIWYTVLPYNKKGIAQDTIIPTEMYSVEKTFAENADMYTAVKVSAIPLNMLTGNCDCTIIIRKSASYSTPASLTDGEKGKTCTLTLLKRTVAPVVQKDYNTGFLAVADEKGMMVMPAINGAYGDKTKGNKFEFAIISSADYEKELSIPGSLDMSSIKWQKFAAGKTITIGKSKSGYRMTGADKAAEHLLSDGDYILIRRCGLKNKNDIYSPFIASESLVTRIGKKTVFGVEKEVWYQIDR